MILQSSSSTWSGNLDSAFSLHLLFLVLLRTQADKRERELTGYILNFLSSTLIWSDNHQLYLITCSSMSSSSSYSNREKERELSLERREKIKTCVIMNFLALHKGNLPFAFQNTLTNEKHYKCVSLRAPLNILKVIL